MARIKVDNKLNVVIGTKAQVEADNTIPDNSIVIVTDEELTASDITQDANNRFVTDTEKATWNGKVTSNSEITGDTKAKITYDSKGLVTAGADLAETDIPPLSPSKITQTTTARFVTDAEKSTWNGKQDALTNVTTADIVTGTATTQKTVTAKVVHDAIMQIMFDSLGGES